MLLISNNLNLKTMLDKLFKTIKESKVAVKTQTVNEIIEEIHETFYTEVDRLLADAKISKSLDTDKQDVIDKSARLKDLGFNSTKEVEESDKETGRLRSLEMDNIRKEHLVKAINYFSFKYPNYKFITEESVKKICEKYNLVYGEVNRYEGEVPDENLKHIEDFKVKEEDEACIDGDYMRNSWNGNISTMRETFRSSKDLREEREEEERKRNESTPMNTFLRARMGSYSMDSFSKKEVCPLEIAAPKKDFNMKGMEVRDGKLSNIEIPDPVVLKPVVFEGRKHYLIVTAWGLEASDELVVNQKMN